MKTNKTLKLIKQVIKPLTLEQTHAIKGGMDDDVMTGRGGKRTAKA